MIGREKGRGDNERKGRTRNQANVSGSRMSMTLLRLSIDSPLRASDGKRVKSTDVKCDRSNTPCEVICQNSATASTLHVSSIGQSFGPRCRRSAIYLSNNAGRPASTRWTWLRASCSRSMMYVVSKASSNWGWCISPSFMQRNARKRFLSSAWKREAMIQEEGK